MCVYIALFPQWNWLEVAAAAERALISWVMRNYSSPLLSSLFLLRCCQATATQSQFTVSLSVSVSDFVFASRILHAAKSLCLTSLPSSSLTYPISFPSFSLIPPHPCLATPGSRCAPQGTLFMQEASFAYCACFFFKFPHIFFRVFRICVFPSRATWRNFH